MPRQWIAFPLIFLLLLNGFSSASASASPTPAKIVAGVVSNVVSSLAKWIWSLKSNPKTVSRLKGLMGVDGSSSSAVSGRSMVKFEDGYTVETVFDGSKLGIEPFSVEFSPTGELMVLDSENSNIYKIQTPLSKYSRPKLVAGSPEGYTGHVDGKLREARMNHPKGLVADDRGNIYIADTMNMAIRKISEGGVTTIAGGGKWSRGGGHVDGPSEDCKLSNDFDLHYVGSSCSLLVVDRGNQVIREIQLHDEDCDYEEDVTTYPFAIAILFVAGFLGYMLALLQRKIQTFFSPHRVSNKSMTMPPYQRPPQSVRPPLIPNEDEYEKPEEGFMGSLGRLVINTGTTVSDIFGFRRKPPQNYQFQQQYQQQLKHLDSWPMQESYVIPNEDVPPPPLLESRYPTSNKSHPQQKNQHVKLNQQHYSSGWDEDYQQQQQVQQHQQRQQQHCHRQQVSNPRTFYEKGSETNEIVFGAVQEQDGRQEAVVIKAVDYADPRYNQHNIRPRYNYVGYSHGY
ncbi:hypothetical protein LINPERPRIM_LOCUS14741 [Linum perenne]